MDSSISERRAETLHDLPVTAFDETVQTIVEEVIGETIDEIVEDVRPAEFLNLPIKIHNENLQDMATELVNEIINQVVKAVKPKELLDLPAEIRDKIFKLVLLSIPPTQAPAAMAYKGEIGILCSDDDCIRGHFRPIKYQFLSLGHCHGFTDTNLLLVNRQIYGEARHALYTSCKLHIQDCCSFFDYLETLNLENRNLVSSVREVSLTARFLWYDDQEINSLALDPITRLRQDLHLFPSLQKLRIIMGGARVFGAGINQHFVDTIEALLAINEQDNHPNTVKLCFHFWLERLEDEWWSIVFPDHVVDFIRQEPRRWMRGLAKEIRWCWEELFGERGVGGVEMLLDTETYWPGLDVLEEGEEVVEEGEKEGEGEETEGGEEVQAGGENDETVLEGGSIVESGGSENENGVSKESE